jgi:hypothetical protein
MRRFKHLIFVLSITMVLGFIAPAAIAQQEEEVGESAVVLQVATLPIAYDIVYARSESDTSTETVVSVQNTGKKPCNVEVQWLFGLGGGGEAGLSGPITLLPGETAEFSTANIGEAVPPYIINAFRDTTNDFEGGARVRTNCQQKKVGVQATLVNGIGYAPGGIGLNEHDLKVIKPSKSKGD